MVTPVADRTKGAVGRPAVPGFSRPAADRAARAAAGPAASRAHVRLQRAGPHQPLALAGLRVVEAIPVAVSPGNVGASFDALSYANHLVVTVVADPTVVPEQDQLTEDLRSEPWPCWPEAPTEGSQRPAGPAAAS